MRTVDERTRNRLLGVLFAGVLMGALDIAIVGPALPAIRRAFGVDDRAAAWIFSLYVLFNLIGAPLMAKLSDLFGRRWVYVLDVSLFAFGSLLVALSPSFLVLLCGRAVQGLGASGVFPVASAVIGDTFPPEKRGRALGMIGAVFGVAFLVGPILGGVLLMFGWPWLFVINLPIAAGIIAASVRLLPSVPALQGRSFDWRGMLVLALMLASFSYGLNRLDTSHVVMSFMSSAVWPFLVGALVLLPVFVWVERGVRDPILRLPLLMRRQVMLVSLFSFGAGLSESAVVFVPGLLVAAFGVTTSTASFMLLPVVLAMAVGSPLSGRALDRFGSRVVVLVGSSLSTLGMLLVSVSAVGLVAFYTAAVLFGLGLSILLGAALRYIMLNEAPTTERASAQSVLTLSSSIGQLMGGAMVGAVAASRGGGVVGYAAAFLVIGVFLLVQTLAALGLKSRAEEQATAQRNAGGGVPASAQGS